MTSNEVSFFSTGMARSGTNLVSKILSANPKMHCVLGANIELYRSVRDQIIQSVELEPNNLIPKGSVFSDFFGKPGYFQILQHLFNETFELDFKRDEFETLRNSSLARFPHDSPDLKPILAEIGEQNSVNYLASLANSSRKIRGLPKEAKIGFHESWHIELFPALQKSFPEAKFMIILRDIRGTYASHKFDTLDNPDWRASIFDYARQFRKYSALSHYLADNFKNVMVFRYEDLMETPYQTVSNMCNFLDVEFDSKMLDPESHIDPLSKRAWSGNSGYKMKVSGFDKERSTRWKSKLSGDEVTGLEMMCNLGLKKNNYSMGWGFSGGSIESLQSLSSKSDSKFHRWDAVKRTENNILEEEENYLELMMHTDITTLKPLLRDLFSPDYLYF